MTKEKNVMSVNRKVKAVPARKHWPLLVVQSSRRGMMLIMRRNSLRFDVGRGKQKLLVGF
jgi:hypothetical protein